MGERRQFSAEGSRLIISETGNALRTAENGGMCICSGIASLFVNASASVTFP